MIDQSAALGGAQETLTGIGLALGQMWSKQKIQTEEILQLVERCVPAFDLLAKVTGKQGAELTKLIESGKLGRKEIKGLIDEIGRSTEGAAAANLGTLSGLVTSLKDRFKEFLETIASSGVVDYFKQQLTGLRDTITRMADDGSLTTWAKNVGAGLVTVGQSVGTFFSGVSVVYNAFKTSVHAAATAIAASLGTVVKAIAFIKELDFKDKMVSDMAGVQSSAQRLHDIADSLYASAAENYDQTGEAAYNLAQAFKDLANSGAQVGSEFGKADPAVAKQADHLRLTGEAAERAKAQFAQLPLSVQKLIGPLIESTGALTGLNKVTNDSAAAFRDQQQAIINARKDVEAAKLAIVELAKSGETSGEAFERANTALVAAERHLANVTAEATRGQAATEGLADAFKTLGIKSQAELQKLADTQRAALETVTAAHRQGEAAIEDVQRAFEAYAATARAAAKDSSEALQQQVEAQLQAEATALGLADKLKQAGDAGKAAGQEVGKAFADAKDSISDAGDAADELKDKTAETADEMADVGANASATALQVNSAINTVLVLTDAQQRALRDINELFYRGKIDGAEYGRRVREAIEGVTESLEDQAEAARRAVDELRELNQQMQDDADRADGNEAAVERRRHQEQLDRIAELEREGGTAARREAAEARQLAEDEHKRRLAEIREEARAERQARREASSSQAAEDRITTMERPETGTALVHELRITVNGQGMGLLDPGDPQTSRAITEAVNRVLRQAMSASGRGGSIL